MLYDIAFVGYFRHRFRMGRQNRFWIANRYTNQNRPILVELFLTSPPFLPLIVVLHPAPACVIYPASVLYNWVPCPFDPILIFAIKADPGCYGVA